MEQCFPQARQTTTVVTDEASLCLYRDRARHRAHHDQLRCRARARELRATAKARVARGSSMSCSGRRSVVSVCSFSRESSGIGWTVLHRHAAWWFKGKQGVGFAVLSCAGVTYKEMFVSVILVFTLHFLGSVSVGSFLHFGRDSFLPRSKERKCYIVVSNSSAEVKEHAGNG